MLWGQLRAWLIRLLGVKLCGEYGGQAYDEPRWCYKEFGHYDSCAYETGMPQPNKQLRLWFKGWTS